MKNNSYAANVKSSLISIQPKLWIMLLSQNKPSIHMSITSFKGILVNKYDVKTSHEMIRTKTRSFISKLVHHSTRVIHQTFINCERWQSRNWKVNQLKSKCSDDWQIGWNLGQLLCKITGAGNNPEEFSIQSRCCSL